MPCVRLCYNFLVSDNKIIGLVSSVPIESALIGRRARKKHKLLPQAWTGILSGRRVVHITSGVGITNAAWATTLLMESFGVGAIVNFGIAGAYPGSGLQVGQVVAATEEVYADTGLVLADGTHDMTSMGIELLKKGSRKLYNTFKLNRSLLKKAKPHVHATGRFLTVAQASGTLKRSRELENRFEAITENMEGAAVAHICARYGVPALELRGISNMVEDRDTSRWQIKPASTNCQSALLGILPSL